MSEQNRSTVRFLGGAGSVTGSNFLLESEGVKILVDCGMFQGGDFCEDANYKPFPFSAEEIDVVLVTHAHVDHIGRIPKLLRDGFRGKIISTEATKGIAEYLLHDSMELLAHDAEKRSLPQLYDEKDVVSALSVWETRKYEEVSTVPGEFSVQFLNAEHILGSAMIELSRAGRSIVFSGDLGSDDSLLVGPIATLSKPNYLLIESVYGNKKHDDTADREQQLERVIEETISRGGTLLIPAFSTERTQDLIYEIRSLHLNKRIPQVPVYVDSPLAAHITSTFLKYPSYFREEIGKRVAAGENIFSFPGMHLISDINDSRKLHSDKTPKIIIAGSGMSHGGRILGYEKEMLPDPKNTILIVGYQGAGSLGRQLLEGVKKVTIMKESVPVRANIETNYGYSAHRDSDGLLEFVHQNAATLEKVFVVMGEPASAAFLSQRIRDFVGLNASVPQVGDSTALNL